MVVLGELKLRLYIHSVQKHFVESNTGSHTRKYSE